MTGNRRVGLEPGSRIPRLAALVVLVMASLPAASALASSYSVWAWGYNNNGELGIAPMGGYTSYPVQPGTGSTGPIVGAIAVAAGSDHSLALMPDGSVRSWGDDYDGELGNGQVMMGSTTPAPVVGPGGTGTLSNVTAIAGGLYTSLALDGTGHVWAWGEGDFGQLGNGSTTGPDTCSGRACSTAPVEVKAPGGGFLSSVTGISLGDRSDLAVKSDGTVWSWGSEQDGELGDGNQTGVQATPVQVAGLSGVKAVAGGNEYSLALKSNGTVWAWGLNNHGQLGQNTTTGPQTCGGPNIGCSATPVEVMGPGGSGFLTGVVAIAASADTGLALKSDGTVWAWGLSTVLGNGSAVDSTTPVQVEGANGSGFLTGVVSIGAGQFDALALTSDGQVWTWGANGQGNLTGNTASSGTPVAVVGPGGTGTLGNVTLLGTGSSTYHSLVVTAAPRVALSVRKAGTGTGTVTSQPGGIHCSPTCSAGFPSGTRLSLTASPGADSRFTGWSGACTGTGICHLTLTVHTSVTATFRARHRPDAQIKLSSDPHYLGAGIFNTTGAGQTRSTAVRPGKSATFDLKFVNAGLVSDAIMVRGCGSSTAFRVSYHQGSTNVTGQVLGGTYRSATIPPGRSVQLTLTVAPSSAAGNKTCVVTASSAAVPAEKDVVKAVL